MKGSSSRKLTRLIRIQCEVTRADIEAMLDDYESGMADATTCNAVSRSIRRTFEIEEPVKLERRRGECPEIRLGGYRVALEKEVTAWLIRVETGFMPKPFFFDLLVPEPLFQAGFLAEATIDAEAKPTAA